jgi:mannose-1-phosphate guanylyltransferase
MKIIPVILAGGAGTRLWPLSREDKPKQFHNISGDGTLLGETIRRLSPINPDKFIIVTSRKYENPSLHELQKTQIEGKVLAEPFPRNTAAAVLYAATYLSRSGKDTIMIMLPADHFIRRNDIFQNILKMAIAQAGENRLVSIGIKPTYPETGYGYIKAMKGSGDVLDVEGFVEKPDIRTAKKYLQDGSYFWNSGIFVWKTSTILENFKKLMPAHFKAFEPMRSMSMEQMESNDKDIWFIKEKVFSDLDTISIDYGIMEKAENRVVIPGDFGWADLGSWNSIDDILPPDDDKNRSPEMNHVLFMDSDNCTVFPESKKITVIGLSNIVVVESGNDILVMEKNSSQEVRRVVEHIREKRKAH